MASDLRRDVAGEIHGVVQNPQDLDQLATSWIGDDPEHDEMPTAPAPPRHVQAAQARADLVARNASLNIRTIVKRSDGAD